MSVLTHSASSYYVYICHVCVYCACGSSVAINQSTSCMQWIIVPPYCKFLHTVMLTLNYIPDLQHNFWEILQVVSKKPVCYHISLCWLCTHVFST